RECGRYRQRDHEPRRTASHAAIVAGRAGTEQRYALSALGRALAGLCGAPRGGRTVRDAVPVLVAERARRILGESVAVPLAVRRTEEDCDDVEVPLAHVDGLAPEVGEAEVDIELEKVEA